MDTQTTFVKLKKRIGAKLKSYIKSYIPEPEKATAHIKKGAGGIAIGGISFLLAGAPMAMGTYPLGLALMCSSNSYVPFIYAGLLTAALFNPTMMIPLFVTWTFAFLLRIAFGLWRNVKLFNESIIFRMVAGVGAAIMISVYRIISGGFLYYDVFAALFEITFVPVMVFIYSCVFDKEKKYTAFYEAGVVGILFSLVYSLKAYNLFGFSLATVTAFMITLYISREGGILRGGVAGLICGLAYNPAYAPAFGLAGIVAGLIWKIGSIAAVAAACIVGIAYGTYLDGFTALRIFAPDLLGASLLFTPLAQFGLLPKLLIYSNGVTVPDIAACNATVAEKSQRDTVMKMEALSGAMISLSEVFYTLSDRLRRPGIYDIKQLCDDTFSSYCQKCKMYAICWEKEYSSTIDIMNKLVKTLHKQGRVEVQEVPPFLSERCPSLLRTLGDLNMSYAELLENSLKSDKIEVFAMDYEAMAKLLDTAIQYNDIEYELDDELCAKLRKTARYIDFYSNNIAVYGKRRKSIVAGGVDLSRVRLSAEEIRNAFENVCGVQLTTPEFNIEKDYISMSMVTMRRFRTKSAKATDIKDNEVINGDNICIFENKEEYFYTLISDGMGSGREAALTSKVTGIFLEKMLSAGNNKSITLEMLNNFIRSKNMESFATVDLLEIDMLSGEASFIKSGAAPSYILRDGSLFKIASNTMPIGITREINAEEIKFTLTEGDVVVMISDGVAQSFDDSIWLANMLTFDWDDDQDLQAMSEKILTGARENNKRSDDMTVGLVKIMAA